MTATSGGATPSDVAGANRRGFSRHTLDRSASSLPRTDDAAPRGEAFPYLSLGRSETAPVDAGGVDLLDHRLTLHLWARRETRAPLKDAIAAVRAALHQADLALAAPYACVLCRVVYTDLFTGPDAATLHGVVRVRAVLETG